VFVENVEVSDIGKEYVRKEDKGTKQAKKKQTGKG
jgi:hypothetical protein